MNFTLWHPGHFIAPAGTGSISLASTRASISRPAISTGISRIERELDLRLLLRQREAPR
jgi:DNA-binding transcriptional LysR family regulator